MLSIGLMSGTSMDGIDAALLETDGQSNIVAKGHYQLRYNTATQALLKAAERAVKAASGNLQQASIDYQSVLVEYVTHELHYAEAAADALIQGWVSHLPASIRGQPLTLKAVEQWSTELHAEAVNGLLEKTGITASMIDVIGYHGQTVFHRPEKKCTIQLGNGQYLAELTGIPVVHDFRQADVQAGGLGAPFAPLYHQALAVRDGYLPVSVVNCGGIANVTLIWGKAFDELLGFDTGPGNALLDAFVKQRTQGRETMDLNGQYGQKGVVNPTVLHALRTTAITQHAGVTAYLQQKPPKALDIRDMQLIPELQQLRLEDGCATLAYFTAESIADSLRVTSLSPAQWPRHWVLAGGGWYNPVIKHALVEKLQEMLGNHVLVQTCDEAGWHHDAMEAQIFAYFAVRSLKQLPLSVPNTTGVPYPISGGRLRIKGVRLD